MHGSSRIDKRRSRSNFCDVCSLSLFFFFFFLTNVVYSLTFATFFVILVSFCGVRRGFYFPVVHNRVQRASPSVSKVPGKRMDAPGETSRVNGENVTKDILKDLIKYRASPKSHPPDFPLKVTMRKISEKIKIEMDVKDPFKPEDLLTNLQALEGVIFALYLHAETEEQQVLYTVCLFTYVAELCKNVQVESRDLIADKVIYVLKSTEKGLFALSLFQKMYDREKTKTTLKKVTLLMVLTAGVLWFVKKR